MRTALLLLLCALLPASLEAQPIRVGAARRKITPLVETFTDRNENGRFDIGEPFVDANRNGRRDSVYLAGYGINRVATHVIDDLWARAIAFRRGEQTVVLCALDLVGYLIHHVARIKRRVLAEAARRKIPLDWGQILICSTHNHHGPDTVGMWGKLPLVSGVDPGYLSAVEKAAAAAILEAIVGAVPAALRHAAVQVPEAVRDIHAPNVTDPELSLLQARTPQGKVIATLLNFASHPELLDSKQTGVSSDYVHFARQGVEQARGGVAVFFAGALGGMQTPPSRWGKDVKGIARVGGMLADAATRALDRAPVDASRHLFAHTRLVELPMDNPKFRLGFRIGLFGKGLKLRREGRALLLPAELSVVRIGGAELVTNPGELYPEIGNAIKQGMRGRTRFILGLCGNEIGYILPRKLWGDPRYKKHRYEESMSLGKRTGPLVREWMERLTRTEERKLVEQRQDIRALLDKLLPE